MAAVYHEVACGSSFPQAMTLVKRRFIRGEFGEAFKAPRHWGGHVYYGATQD
jgi:hypothetical protein